MSPLGEVIRLGWGCKDTAPETGLLCSLGKGETPMFSLCQECGPSARQEKVSAKK